MDIWMDIWMNRIIVNGYIYWSHKISHFAIITVWFLCSFHTLSSGFITRLFLLDTKYFIHKLDLTLLGGLTIRRTNREVMTVII